MDDLKLERNQAYTLALAAAKSEYDEIVVDWQKIVARVMALRHAMKGLAHLLDEDLDEKYQFAAPKPVEHGHEVKTRRK